MKIAISYVIVILIGAATAKAAYSVEVHEVKYPKLIHPADGAKNVCSQTKFRIRLPIYLCASVIEEPLSKFMPGLGFYYDKGLDGPVFVKEKFEFTKFLKVIKEASCDIIFSIKAPPYKYIRHNTNYEIRYTYQLDDYSIVHVLGSFQTGPVGAKCEDKKDGERSQNLLQSL